MSEVKVCRDCLAEKANTEFYTSKRYKDGLSVYCKECLYKRSRDYIKKNKDKALAYHRQYAAKKYEQDPEYRGKKLARSTATREKLKEEFKVNPEAHEEYKKKFREYTRNFNERHKDRLAAQAATPEAKLARRESFLKRKYNLTPQQWDAMQAKNANRCWICNEENLKGRTKKLVVDHCHATGKVRGALCDICNQMLGALGDTIPKIRDSTERFIKYLEAAELLDVTAL